jgi:Kef-type K+ transport system membrane component KefB
MVETDPQGKEWVMVAFVSGISSIVLLFGGLVLLAVGFRAGLHRAGLPPLLGFLLIGMAVGWLDGRWGLLGATGREVMEFLARLGVIALLFRVGLESDLAGLVRQLGGASFIWVVNLVVSGLAGWVAARYVLGWTDTQSLVVAVALTATSVGVPSAIWQRRGLLDTPDGEAFLDVAELDDLSGVVLMALLLAVLPALHEPASTSLGGVLARKGGVMLLKLLAFVAGCWVFSRYVEKRYTGFFRRIESGPNPMLVVVGTGVVVAALAGQMGFSMAVGAFLAGLMFSRDPQSVKVDASFGPLHELLSPFFFIGIGLRIDLGAVPAGLAAGAVLLAAAMVGKLVGTIPPALCIRPWPAAAAIGVSMIPRAEITMLIMSRGMAQGSWAVTDSGYAGMLLVSMVTCLIAPVALRWLLARREVG